MAEAGGGRTTRAQRAAAARMEHLRRRRLAEQLAGPFDGVLTRAMLLNGGLTRGQIEVEVGRGALTVVGVHTLSVTGSALSQRASWFRALWESGRRSVLDGVTALQAGGLKGWSEDTLHVSVPNNATVRPLDGVRHHLIRDIGPVVSGELRRTRPAVAVVRAAQWAASDRAAATLVAMTVQQGLATSTSVLERWAQVQYSARRQVLHEVILDVCDGARSLNELDFAQECRRRGLPEPSRQAVRTASNGRVYLDVFWEDLGVHVEIQGAQHFHGLAGVEDALRFNDLGLRDRNLVSLQVPVLGLRTRLDAFMVQVEQALSDARLRQAG